MLLGTFIPDNGPVEDSLDIYRQQKHKGCAQRSLSSEASLPQIFQSNFQITSLTLPRLPLNTPSWSSLSSQSTKTSTDQISDRRSPRNLTAGASQTTSDSLDWGRLELGLKIGATNHLWETSWNYSTAEGEKIMIAAQACQQPETSSERGTGLTTCQYHFECFSVNTALWEISFTSTALHTHTHTHTHTHKKKTVNIWRMQEEKKKKKSEQLIFETAGRQFKKKNLLCWSLSMRLLDQTVLSNFRQLTPVCRRSYVRRKRNRSPWV